MGTGCLRCLMLPPPLRIALMSSMRTSRPGKRRLNSCCDFHDRGAGRLRHDHDAVIIRADDVARAGRQPDDRLIDHHERLLVGALREEPIAEHLEAELADRRARSAGSLLPKNKPLFLQRFFMFSNLFGVSGDENVPQARLCQMRFSCSRPRWGAGIRIASIKAVKNAKTTGLGG